MEKIYSKNENKLLVDSKKFRENRNKALDYIMSCEENYFKQIDEIAENIKKSGKRVILITGPSGSGKTTTAKMIQKKLKKHGLNGVYLSMDDWFLGHNTNKKPPLTEDGKIDLESPEWVNMDLLNENIASLLRGETIHLPTYDFVKGESKDSGKTLTLNDSGSIIIIEGIHALNDLVKVDKDLAYYVLAKPNDYVLNDGSVITQNEIRLYRRIQRDKLHRGRTKEETLEMFSVVSRGEHKYLEPTLDKRDFTINTLLGYEIYLHKMNLGDFRDLSKVTDKSQYIYYDDIPVNSVLNEFFK